MEKSKSSGDSGLIRILTLILAVSIAANVILVLKRTDVFPAKKELISANETLTKQVQQYKTELNKFKGITGKIDAMLADANTKMEAKEKQIAELLKNKRYSEKELGEKNKKLMFELDSLQNNYINIVDSLLVEREKTKVINNKIESLEEVISELNKKVGIGSWLIGDNLKAVPQKVNNSGKKQATAIARKTNEIDVCLDILENRISKSGMKNIFFVVTSPDAEVIFDKNAESPKFNHPEYKKLAECSKIESIDYKNQKLNLCSTIQLGKTPGQVYM